MTNNYLDLQHAKLFVAGGSNFVENHPMATKYVMMARDKGAKIIHVDVRFNRTSSIADLHTFIRPGTDIAYLGAIIHYLIANKRYDEKYVTTNTNGLFLIKDDFNFTDGVFSGYSEADHKYDNASWGYVLDEATHLPKKAESLDDPRCVLQRLKAHFSRYTFETASEISGIEPATIKKIADMLVEYRPATFMYALGMTQHTTGVQGIRCYCMIQLLLGNIGVSGGGVSALRGQPNVQGACDMSDLYNYITGYVAQPDHNLPTLKDFAGKYGSFRAKFVVNLLKAWFGDLATPENDFCYGMLMKKNGKANYSMYKIFENALEGKVKFLHVMGMNPFVTQPNLSLVFKCLCGLEMLVVQDLWETETAAFWQAPGADAKSIKTEVILLPAAYAMEKTGTITGSGRLVQWRYQAVPPPGEAREDLEILDSIFKKVRSLYQGSTAEQDQIILKSIWNYDNGPVKAEEVLKEINGKNWTTGELIGGIGELQADGTTSSGSWIYAGIMKGGKNLTQRRDSHTDPSGMGVFPGFAWSWPGNMHILYNRAGCDAEGKPFDPKRAVIWWDAEKGEWGGFDTPDVPVKTDGPDTPNGQRPFRMTAEGVGRLFAAPYKHPEPPKPDSDGGPAYRDSSGVLVDGPLPEFYEPVESPVSNLLHPNVPINPVLKYPRLKEHQPIGTIDQYPYVLSTASMVEHWCGGSTTRNIPKLNELMPEPWVEVPLDLAQEKGIKSGDLVEVSTARGSVRVKAMVTPRMRRLKIQGKVVNVIWMPYNWGFKGLSTGPSTNYLTIDAGDPNVWCQESKACLANLELVSKGGAR